MATRRTQLDIRTKGGDDTKRTLSSIGSTGERAFKRIEKSSKPANRALMVVSKTSARLQRGFETLAGPRGIAAVTAAGTGFALMAERALQTAENLQDVSDRVGINVERLQELQFAFDQNGVSVEQTNAGLRRFQRRIGLAVDGSGAARDAVEALNVELTDSAGRMRDTGDLFDEFARKLAEVESPARRAALASQLFGEDAGPAMAVLLGKGTGAIDDYGRQLRELGGFMGEDMVEDAAKASAELRALRRVTATAFQSGLIEGFVGEFDSFADAVSSPEFQQGVRAFGEMLGETASFVAQHGEEVIKVFGALAGARAGGMAGGALGTMVGRPGIGRAAGTIVGGAAGYAAPSAFGVGVSDMEMLQAEAEKTERRLGRVREQLEKPGVQNTPTLLEPLQAEAEKLDMRLGQIRARIAELNGGGGANPAADPGAGAAPSPSPRLPGRKPDAPDWPDTRRGKLSGAEIAAMSAANIERQNAALERQAEAFSKAEDAQQEHWDALREAGEQVRARVMTPFERYSQSVARLERLHQAGAISAETYQRAMRMHGAELAEATEQQSTFGSQLERLQSIGEGTFQALNSGLEDAIFNGESLSSVMQGLAQDVARMAFRKSVTEPLAGLVSSGLSSGLGAILGGGGADLAAGDAILNAGGSLDSAAAADIAANPQIFGKGGVTDRPAIFGEAGPEAAVPLPDGRRIPVDLRGGQAGGGPIHVTMNIRTQDAQSFRRSRQQVMAETASALQRARDRNG